ncbi:MAG: glycosyltransferase family 2 protein [Euryarchaeota archaeon]|nr:glycosyltransferase family 2 protein [Euryarchaeota archaeon]
MERLDIIVPVASYEPLSVLKKSVDCILDLEKGDLDLRIIYVLDIRDEDDSRLNFLEEMPFSVIARTDNRGRRAGAINDALDVYEEMPDYIALFDVDSRPDRNFLVECVGALRSNQDAVIASSARFITNADENLVTRTISAEYFFFSDVYRIFKKLDGFNQFNGLIGVLNTGIVEQLKLNESVSCEDLDFTQKIYLSGFTGVFTPETMVGEQAPSGIRDLFNQRVRWLTGACQGLRTYMPSFVTSEIPISRKLAWFLSLSIPFVAFIGTPFVPMYGLRLWRAYGMRSAIIQTFGLAAHLWLITLCGIVALAKQVFGGGVEWKESRRSEV